MALLFWNGFNNGLHFCFEDSSILTESAQTSAPVMGLPASTPVAKLGCARGFLHKVKISPNFTPVPLTVWNVVCEERQCLLELIIEKVDASLGFCQL